MAAVENRAMNVAPGSIINIAAKQANAPQADTYQGTLNLGRQEGLEISSSKAALKFKTP